MMQANSLFTVTSAILISMTALFYGQAAEYALRATDVQGTTSFNVAGHWSSGQAPQPGHTYTTDNFQLRTPESGSHIFAGDALTIASTGTMLWKGPDNSSITISNLIFRGTLNHGCGNVTGKIYGNIQIPSGATATIGTGPETDRRIFQIHAPISGSGALNLFLPRLSGDMKEVQFSVSNPDFTGPIKIMGRGKLSIFSEEDLGGNPPEWNPRQFTFNGAVLRFSRTMTLDDPNRGIWLSNMTVSASHVYPGGRFEIASGTIATVDCLIGGEGPLEKVDLGTLVLSATNTYTGSTTVHAGTLLINSPTNATASLSVAPGAAFGGTGTIHCAATFVTNSAVALAGNGYGTLSLAHPAGVTLEDIALSFELQDPASGVSDCLALAGPLTLSGANTVSAYIPATGLPAGSYTLVTYPSCSGDGTLTMTPAYPNAELIVGETAITLEVTGSGTAPVMTWKGNASDNTWSFTAGNWYPGDAAFVNGADVLLNDSGVASTPVLISDDVTVRDMTIATTNNAYTLDTASHVLFARNVVKFGTAALTLKGDHRYNTFTIGHDTGSGFTGGGAVTLDAAFTLGSGGCTVRPSAGTFTQTRASVLTGSGHLTIGSAANLYGTNTFTGTATIGYQGNAKSITLHTPSALGSTTGGTILRGGTSSDYNRLILANGVTITDEPLTVSGGTGYRAGLWSAAGGTACWDGSIVIASDGQLQIGSGSGNTFTIGSPGRTAITNNGSTPLSFRDAGTHILNSRLAMSRATLNRDDAGTLIINSTENIVSGINFLQGGIRLNVDNPFNPAPSLIIGKSSDSNIGNKSIFDLNGHMLTLSRLQDAHGDALNNTANEGYQRILCSQPSTLIVNGTSSSSYAKVGSIMSGPLTLIKDGSGEFSLGQTNALSGAVIVSNGVFIVTASGSFGSNATNIVVADGTLSLLNNTAVCPAARVVFADGGSGKINLPAGISVTIDTLWHGEKQRLGGTHGASGSGAQHVDDTRFTGTGILTVRRGNGGTALFVK